MKRWKRLKKRLEMQGSHPAGVRGLKQAKRGKYTIQLRRTPQGCVG